ncbi:MAG: isoprenylcysteine carboxylmethyltransferase family protein [archaeon]
MKRYQIENIIPFLFTILIVYFITSKFTLNTFFILGFLLSIIGIIIWWLGKLTLHNAFTAMPKAKKLMKKGIYSKIRHPIYFGLSLILIGWMILFQNWIIMIIFSSLIMILIIRAYFEEKILDKRFGKEYRTYKKETWF